MGQNIFSPLFRMLDVEFIAQRTLNQTVGRDEIIYGYDKKKKSKQIGTHPVNMITDRGGEAFKISSIQQWRQTDLVR